jgi:hypothetical protein
MIQTGALVNTYVYHEAEEDLFILFGAGGE